MHKAYVVSTSGSRHDGQSCSSAPEKTQKWKKQWEGYVEHAYYIARFFLLNFELVLFVAFVTPAGMKSCVLHLLLSGSCIARHAPYHWCWLNHQAVLMWHSFQKLGSCTRNDNFYTLNKRKLGLVSVIVNCEWICDKHIVTCIQWCKFSKLKWERSLNFCAVIVIPSLHLCALHKVWS